MNGQDFDVILKWEDEVQPSRWAVNARSAGEARRMAESRERAWREVTTLPRHQTIVTPMVVET